MGDTVLYYRFVFFFEIHVYLYIYNKAIYNQPLFKRSNMLTLILHKSNGNKNDMPEK